MIKPEMYANLHNHSTHSDGVYNVEEITSIAKNEGYRAIALTDHDTVTGNSEMEKVAKKNGMESLFGCEFMTRSSKLNLPFHITAFGFDAEDAEMKEYLRRCSVTMTERTRACFEIGKEKELLPKEIEWSEVVADNPTVTWLCNDHVFRTMKRKGLAEDKDYPPFLTNIFFKYWHSVPDAYEKLPLEELIPLIKRVGGLVVVAHPHGALDKIAYLKKIGIDGMEVWHPDLTKDEIPEALKVARDLDLYISGGPDHSGLCGGQYSFYEDYKNCEWYIDELSVGTTKELFNEIKERRRLTDRKDLINEYLEYYARS